MNRKILSFALALTLVLLLSVSCGGASSTVKTSDIPSSAASSETTAATSATVSTSSVPKEQTTSVKTAATSGNGDFAFEIYDFGTSGAKKLFILDYYADYSFGEFLKKGAESTEELIKYLITSFPKAKVDISSLGYGCSAYFTESCDNEFIYGRNFDMSAEMTGAYLVVHTRPENGYESYSTVNLGFIGVKKVSGTAEETAKALSDGTSPLLLSPYIPLDGMNEKGVAISILQLDYPEIHQTSEDNIDITPTTMIRNILDNAADLEEAVAIFKNCNMHTDGYAYHYLVSDASGKSAVIEYVDGKTVTVYKTDEQRSQTVANEFISDEGRDFYNVKDGNESDIRVKKIEDALNDLGYDVSPIDNAIKALAAAKQNTTRWSLVYNLTNKTVDICIDRNFSRVCHLSGFSAKK